jgi:hypothetical protein
MTMHFAFKHTPCMSRVDEGIGADGIYIAIEPSAPHALAVLERAGR